MKTILITSLILLSIGFVQAQDDVKVYHWVDDDGVTHFSGVPTTENKNVEEVIIEHTPSASSGPIINSRTPLQFNKKNTYKGLEIEISSPINDATIRENSGNITISATVTPLVPRGSLFQLILDGAVNGKNQSSSYFSRQNLDRGTHTAVINLISRSGKVIAVTEAVTFHLHRSNKAG